MQVPRGQIKRVVEQYFEPQQPDRVRIVEGFFDEATPVSRVVSSVVSLSDRLIGVAAWEGVYRLVRHMALHRLEATRIVFMASDPKPCDRVALHDTQRPVAKREPYRPNTVLMIHTLKM